MRSFLIRAASGAAVAAVAAVAALTLAGPAYAAPAHVRAHTTLSIVTFRNVIKAGHKDAVGGTLRAGRLGLAKEAVILDRVVGRKLVPVNVKLTNKNGAVAFIVWPKETTRYELVFEGTRKLAPTHSGIVTVKVRH